MTSINGETLIDSDGETIFDYEDAITRTITYDSDNDFESSLMEKLI